MKRDQVVIDKDTKKPDDFERHVILYAKHHYKHEDTFKDIKKIMAECYGLKVKYIQDFDVFRRVLEITWPYLTARGLLEDIERAITWSKLGFSVKETDTIPIKELLEWLLGDLSIIPVYESKTNYMIIDLGEPDFSILPRNPNSVETKEEHKKLLEAGECERAIQ